MDRPTRHETNLKIAETIAQRATCGRAKIGCVITVNHRIVSTGYNGPVMRGKHCDDLHCNLQEKCQYSVHAEANAICAAAKAGISLQNATLYSTVEPCYECAKLIIQAGITSVKFRKLYTTSSNSGSSLLRDNDINVEWIDE